MNYVGHQLQNNFQQGVGNDGWLPPQAPSLNHEVETVCWGWQTNVIEEASSLITQEPSYKLEQPNSGLQLHGKEINFCLV